MNTAQNPVRVRVPGKINIALAVGPLRSDGYHAVASLYAAVSLYEELTATRVRGNDLSVTLDGAMIGGTVPLGEENLAVQAARLLAQTSEQRLGAHLHITKRVPVAGGMGGGSADAAGALLACNELWNLQRSLHDLLALGATLGADVPFALLGGVAEGSGAGEQLRAIPNPRTMFWVLVLAEQGLSTPGVFAQLDALRARAAENAMPHVEPQLIRAVQQGDPYALAPLIHNDLQPAALALSSDLHEVLEDGIRRGALTGVVSGSGPTVALLCRDERHSQELAASMSSVQGRRAIAVRSPVEGARLLALRDEQETAAESDPRPDFLASS